MVFKHTKLAAIFLCLNLNAAFADSAGPLPGVALDGEIKSTAALQTISRELNFKPKLILLFLQWPKNPKELNFPKQSLDAIWDFEAVPILTWEPMFLEGKSEVAIPAAQILAGDYDPYIRGMAALARSSAKPLIIRFMHEMNLDRYHWGSTAEAYGPKSVADFKEIFRYAVTQFRSERANNVLFAFCPNAESVPPAPWNQLQNYYPGDQYVDIVGLDGYNWGNLKTKAVDGWGSKWRSFADIFKPSFEQLRLLTPNKPLVIFETASTSNGGDKTEWAKQAFQSAKEWGVTALIWFHVNKETDWRFPRGVKVSAP